MRAEDPRSAPVEPWRSFLGDLDGLLKDPVELRCPGGFVVTQQYGIGRETSDIDFLAVIAQSPDDNVETLAGLGSKLHRRYRLYMQHVGVATPPADYARSGTAVFRPARASKASRRAAPVPARHGVQAARFRLYRQILSPRMTCRARPQRRSAKGKCRIVARTDWTQPRDLCTFRAAYRP